MSAPQDERADLTPEQRMLLWCMRAWVVGRHRQLDVQPRLQEMMARLDAPEAAPYLEGFMFALLNGATRPIAVACVCRPQLSADERGLLDVFGLAQESRPFEALLLLRGMLTHEGARAALRSAEGLGAALARMGRFLDAPETSISQFALMTGVSNGAAAPDAAPH